MKTAIRENKWLIALATVLLVVALLITLFPALQADAQGTCYVRYIKYWSSHCQCYVTVKQWVCTGYVQPRRMRSWR